MQERLKYASLAVALPFPPGQVMTSQRVVVVVLNWNGWKDTISCLKSLQLQSYTNAELLVIDNASTDNSVVEINRAIPNVQVLQSGANLGFGGGCNVGIRQALLERADYVWLINSDATADPQALKELVEMADKSPKLASVGSVIYEADATEQIQLWGGGRVRLWTGASQNQRAPARLDFLSGASVLLRCAALEQVGLFDESTYFMYWEDTDLSFRLRAAGWQLGVAETSRIWHRQSASVGKGSTLLDEYFTRSGVRFFRRYAPIPFVSIGLMLCRMLIKRLLTAQFGRAYAVVKGYLNA
jgi:GT2 family glycosyltransferase